MFANTATEIIDNFISLGWKYDVEAAVIELKKNEPDQLLTLLFQILKRIQSDEIFLHTALAFLPAEKWNFVISEAINLSLTEPSNLAAKAVIAAASMQFPQKLQPHLETLFLQKVNFESPIRSWPWRLSTSSIDNLRFAIQAENSWSTISWSAENILQTENAESHIWLADKLSKMISENKLSSEDVENVYLKTGCHPFNLPSRKLFLNRSFHIIFSQNDYFDKGATWGEFAHPSWKTPDELSQTNNVSFGGYVEDVCIKCSRNLSSLINLRSADEMGFSGMRDIQLSFCIFCLNDGRGPLFYQHDASGNHAANFKKTSKKSSDISTEYLLPFQACVHISDNRWDWQDWWISNGRENLNKIGGFPSWIQSPEFPQCKKCNLHMIFVSQFDSIFPSNLSEQCLWGSGGLLYVFWCSNCRISAFNFQCT